MEEENKQTTQSKLAIFGQSPWAVGTICVLLLLLLIFVVWSPNQSQKIDTDSTMEEMVDDKKETPSANTENTSNSGYQASGPSRIFENGQYVNIVRFDGRQFIPSELTVNAGESVRFVNNSTLSMRVGSRYENLSSASYSYINQPNSGGSGTVFELQLTKQGTWAYENLPNAQGNRILGVINVR